MWMSCRRLCIGAFDYMQRDGEGDPDERTWLRDETGGSVYLRLSTNPIEQPQWRKDEGFKQGVIDGAYWMREPGPNAEIVIAYQGVVAPEVIEAAGRIGEDRRDIGVLACTSADRLNAGWTAAQRARRRGEADAQSQIDRLLAQLPPHCTIITVTDGHPATLGCSVLLRDIVPCRWAWNILGKPAPSPTSMPIMVSMPMRL